MELIVQAQTDQDLEDTAEEEQLIHLHQQTLEAEEEQELSMLTHQTITHQAEEANSQTCLLYTSDAADE